MIQHKQAPDGVGDLNARAGRAQRRDVISAVARRIVERLESRTMLSAVSENALPEPYLPPQHDLVNLNGFLSGPSAGQALQIAQNYLHAHAGSLGVSAADLDAVAVTDQYTDSDTGVTHIYMRQTLNDLPVANANLVVNVTRDGRVLNVAGGFVPGLGASQAVTGPVAVNTAATPAIDAVQGLRDAASDLGLTLTGTPSFVQGSGASGAGADGSVTLAAPGVSSATVPAALEYVWTPNGVTLSWDLQIQTTDGQHWYDVNVDATGATSGMVLANDWVDHASYNVMQLPNESANEGTRSIVTDPNDTTMSPFGWHDTNGVAGAEYTITRGNNVYAYTDTANTNTPGFSPDGTSALNFNFAWDTTQSPSTTANQSAAVTNLFYLNNTLHDIHARYGFTEAAGNFQTTNYTGLGAGNDPVLAEAQDGGGTNNANFATPADGSSPRMQMYLWTYATPSRDGDLDNGIVIHEYGHGVSNRLTGGPANANALTATQSGGMGEGWSDWWALMLTQRATDLQNSAYPMGTWALNQPATGAGIRRYPYSYNTSIDPETFGLYGGANGTEVHNTGELWATTLWDMNWLLIQKYGFGANVAAGYDPATPGQNGGNELALRLVMDGLKLQPANPSFVDARNAIIAADQALNGGQDLFQIWTAFARRGLGYSAVDTSSSATSITTATDLPVGLLNPRVASQSPTGVQTSPVSSLDFTFSKAMDPTSFNVAADVASFTGPGSVDLKPAITGFSWLNGNSTLHVTFTPQSTDGTYKMVIGPQILSADNGSPMDQDGDGTTGEPTQDQYTGSFGYDSLPMQVALTTPANGSLVSLPLTTLDVKFNEPYDPATIGTSDLTLSEGTVTNAAVVDATTVRYTLSAIVSEGTLTVSMAAGALNDTDGFPMVAYAGSFATDIGTRAMPATTGVAPAGSLIYQTSAGGSIGTASDTDSFTISLDAGQTLTVVITNVSALQPSLRVTDSLSNLLGTATAAAAGKSAVLQTLPVASAGTYTIAVSGAAGTMGAYTVNATLNAAQEAETYNGPTNDTQATAQNIDASFASLGGGIDRGAVLGVLPASTGVPIFTENFDSGTLGSAWSTYSSDATLGHVFLSGAYGPTGSTSALLMDHNDSSGATYNLNEAVWTVDLTGRTAATLTFSQTTFSDENDVLATDFTGHANGDGVAISADGTHWHTVWAGDSTAQNPTWGAVSIDLAAAATAAGMTLGPNFKIKFQQYDNYNITTDGRGFDNVAITAPAAAKDWYSLTMSAGTPATFAVARTGGSAGESVALYDAGGNLLVSGAGGATNVDQSITNFVAPATGTYYVQVSGSTGNGYSVVVTRNAGFSLQPHNSFGTAQGIDGTVGAVGALAPTSTSTNLVVPATLAGMEGNSGNYYPFGASQQRYQQIYTASQFGTGGVISAIRFRRDSGQAAFSTTIPNIQIDLAYAATTVGTVSSTFASNVGATDTVVYSGSLSLSSSGSGAPAPFDIVIPLSHSFTYNPALGDLLMDVRLFTGASNVFFDATGTGQQTVTTRVRADGNVTATTGVINYDGTAGINNAYGLVTRFDFATPIASEDWYSINVAATGSGLGFSTTTPGDGPGEFTNTLSPHLEIYDPNGNLVASGLKLPDGRNESVSYQAPGTGTYRVRVVAQNSTTGEYVLHLGDAVTLTVPGNVNEGDGTVNATITASTAPTTDLTITLTSSDPTRIGVPATIVLPAGQTSVSVPLTVIDDALLNGPQAISITATAPGYFAGGGVTTIHDNEPATLVVSLPATTTEGAGTINGTVTVSAAPTRDIAVQLASSRIARLTVPATVTIPAGQTTANFVATVINNTLIDGTQDAVVTASVENWTSGRATVSVADNDNLINVSIPASGWEGQSLTGTVTIGGTLGTSLVVNLSSDDTTEMTVPSTVTIAAGAISATFTVTLPTDALKDGSQAATLTASASGLTSGSGNIVVHDANLDHVTIDAITGPNAAGTAFSIAARAFNIAGEAIATYASTGTLSAIGQAGNEPVTPTSATFSAGVWTGSVTLTVADAAVAITMTTGGVAGTSNAFAVQPGAVSTYTWGSVSSPQIANVPFPETLTAKDAYGNIATNYVGSASLSGLVGTTTSQTILGNSGYTSSSAATYTLGYAFTPSSNATVTAVRSFFGTKVTIWTDTGTLLASQGVTSTNGVWTETPLTTPITLTAGTRYRIGIYTNGGTYYWRTDLPTFSWGTINGGYYNSIDGFPSTTTTGYYLVDLRANVGNFTTVPITPTAATFTNGVWSGSISIGQGAAAMHLHAADASSHGDSANFDVIQRTLTLSLPSDVREDDGTVNGLLSVAPTPGADLVVTLASSDPSRLSVPATITIPAGQTSVPLPLTILDNGLLDGLEGVTITATASTYSSAPAVVNVHDNETAALSISLPATAKEGVGTVAGTITASAAPAVDTLIQLTSSKPGRATVPATVTLKAGQTTASFNVTILDNAVIDGDTLVSIGAAADNWTGGFKSLTVQDNDNTLTFTLPTSGWEGQTLSGSVAIGGTLGSDLIVNLSSVDTTELTLPATVTIPAGQKSAAFTATLPTDGIKDGTQTANITATASGMVTGNAGVAVHDVDVDHLAFDAITGSKTAGTAFPVTARVLNIANETIVTYAGSGSLSAAGVGGSEPVAPTSLTFASGVWSGNVTLTVADAAVSLAVTGAGGVSATSGTFAVQPGAASSFAWGAVGGTQTAGVAFAETITAKDASGNVATGFNGTVNLSTLVGATTSQTMLGSPTFTTSNNSGTFTVGYAFTPNTNIQVTHVRSYFGTKVSFWSNTGTLLGSQVTSGTPTTWTETPMTTPITLTAGTTYRITVYTAGQLYYWRNVAPTNPSFATLGQTYEISGDAFPNTPDTGQYWLVDLRGNVGAFTTVPMTPTTATFVNGVWSGNVTVTQPATGAHLHADDGASHVGDSGNFNVINITSPATLAPDLLGASDSGLSATDNITNFNNASAAKALQFQVGGTTAGATVSIYADGKLLGSAVAGGSTTLVTSDGATAVSEGVHAVTARQTVPGQSQSADSPSLSITIDTVAPSIPSPPDLEAASDSGLSDHDDITNVNAPTVDVQTSEAGIIHLMVDDVEAATRQVGAGGTYAISLTTALADGSHVLRAWSQDVAGNQSGSPVLTQVVQIDTVAPATPVGPDLQSGSDRGVSATDNITNDALPTFDVATSEKGRIHLGWDGSDDRVAMTASGAGTYALTASTVTGGFFPVQSYPAGGNPSVVGIADFNGDGRPDLVVPGGSGSTNLSILLGGPGGTFKPYTQFAGAGHATNLAVGDLNNDGKMDFIYTIEPGFLLYLRLGNGDGTFKPETVVDSQVAQVPSVVDLNHDGNSDVVTGWADGSQSVLRVLFGNGDGTFKPPVVTVMALKPYDGAYAPSFGDINGDGKLDVIFTDTSNDSIYSTLGNGDGTFQAVQLLTSPGTVLDQSVLGDVNNDGKLDIVVGMYGRIATLLGNGNGSFQPAKNTVVGGFDSVRLADLNNDGTLDMISTDAASNLYTALGNGDGTFGKVAQIAVNSWPLNPIVQDLNGDGLPDIICPNRSTGTISVLLSASGSLPEGVHSFTVWTEDVAGNKSPVSAPLSVTIDTTSPTVSLDPVTPDPHTTAVGSEALAFSEAVAGLTKDSFTLTRDGSANLLDGSQTLTTGDSAQWTLGGLSNFTNVSGQYVLGLGTAGVTDLAGNALAIGATVQWNSVISAPQVIEVDGTSGDDAIILRMDATGQNLQAWINAPTTGAPTATYPVNSFTRLVVDGAGGNDAITVDLSNGPIPAADGIAVDGGSGGSVVGNDSLIVVLPAGGGAMSIGASSLTLGGVAASYADFASIVIDGGVGNDAVTQMAQPGASLSFAGGTGNDTLTVNGGSFTLPLDAAGSTANLSINVGNGGAVTCGSSQHLAALNISGAGSAVMASAASAATPNVLTVGSLTLGGAASVLEINNNELVATVGLSYIESCVAGGNIRASAAGMFLGYLDLGGGQAEVRATLGGDTNLDGKVDVTDLGNLASAYGMSAGATWVQGDTNDDGHVDVTDLGNLASNYGADLAAGLTAAAAPAAMSQVATPATSVFADASTALLASGPRPSSSATLAAISGAWADDPEALMAEARRRRLELLA